MAHSERQELERIYHKAQRPEDLPWHRAEPWVMLRSMVAARAQPGRALDLGCGAGNFSIYLADHGYTVTALDYLEVPLRMAMQQAHAANIQLRFVHADVLTWNTAEQFDLILDSGCLHSLRPGDRIRYQKQVVQWLAPHGDYVLMHFGKRHVLDWRPIGPRRRQRQRIVDEFAAHLHEHAYAEEMQTGIPLPIGPQCLVGQYWFKRR